jgi:hypothetical protein
MSNAKPQVTAPEPDRVLFKYMRKAHAQRLLSEGVVRIGTLYEYRNIEKHGLVVGDDAEGTKSAVMHVPDLTMTKQEHVPEFVRQRVVIAPNTTVHMINSKFVVSEESPNYYVFSLAEEYSAPLLKAFGYDTCVRIASANGFFSTLNRCFRHHFRTGGLHQCVYMPREVPPDEQHEIHPALIKDPGYANQREFRFIWEPKAANIRPVVLKCRKLAKWCALVA